MHKIKIAPSILSADFAHLGDQVRAAEAGGADWIHIDVMDGHFVPNITIGPLIVKALRPITTLPLDVHLMIQNPGWYLTDFVQAGADHLIVHLEADPHLHRLIQRIHELGAKPGVALNPATPLSALEEILPYVDLVLVMSVNPGFGGQTYISSSTEKIRRLRKMLDTLDRSVELEVDGGISPHTAPPVVEAGATVLVAGSAVFNSQASIAENIAALRQAV